MSSIFEQWNQSIDTKTIAKEAKDVQNNGGSGDFAEIPPGKYEVRIEKMELMASKKGDPMFHCMFRIVNGRYNNQCMFMYAVINQGWQIGNVNTFLKSLDTNLEIEFKDYEQYNNLVLDVMEQIDKQGLEYLVEMTKKNDFPIYKIKDVYEK